MVKGMVKESKHFLMDLFTKETTLKMKFKVMEYFNGQIKESMKVNGLKTKCMEKVN